MYGLSDELVRQMIDAAAAAGAQKLVLFGSRARGDERPASDIDLAVYGLSGSVLPLLCGRLLLLSS